MPASAAGQATNEGIHFGRSVSDFDTRDSKHQNGREMGKYQVDWLFHDTIKVEFGLGMNVQTGRRAPRVGGITGTTPSPGLLAAGQDHGKWHVMQCNWSSRCFPLLVPWDL